LPEISLTELIAATLSSPTGAIVVFIQFLLGVLLGYIVAKILKYVVAMVAILILGSILSIWSLSNLNLSQETLSKIGVSLETLKNIALSFAALLVGPIAIGFIIGVLIGLLRK
jgi:uncharacterized membrane protein (Fun14 family)